MVSIKLSISIPYRADKTEAACLKHMAFLLHGCVDIRRVQRTYRLLKRRLIASSLAFLLFYSFVAPSFFPKRFCISEGGRAKTPARLSRLLSTSFARLYFGKYQERICKTCCEYRQPLRFITAGSEHKNGRQSQ